MSTADVWVGLDLGTQSVRALAVTADGTVAGSGSRKLTGRRDGPRHEQDPDDWWHAVAAASRDALREVPPAAVRGVAVDATSGTVLLVDPDGTPLTPGLMYDDTRAAAEVDRVNEIGGAVWRELGYQRMQPAWALPKLLWLLREHADLVPRARLAHQSDLVTGRLAGAPVATDLSNALKTGADLVDESWPTQVFDALGVPAHVLPPLVRPGNRDRHRVRRRGGGDRPADRHPDRRRGHRRLRGPARRRGAARGELELRARDDAGAQGGVAGAGPRPVGGRVLAQGAQRRLAARRGVQHRRRRDLPRLPRRRPRRPEPAGRAVRAVDGAGLPAGVDRRALPVRRPAGARGSCSALPRTTATGSPPCCRASRSSSGCASTISTCWAPRSTATSC